MASISEEQKSQIISLLQEGQFGREEIASRVGVSPGTVPSEAETEALTQLLA